MSWDDVSFVLASKNRKLLLQILESPKTPTILARNTDLNLANVSRTLTELTERGLIECLTPKKRVGRIYGLTKKGKTALLQIRKMNISE